MCEAPKDSHLEDGTFLMDIDEDALTAMDEADRRAAARYEAALARDVQLAQFDRD